jgi:hypothetical protein
MIFIVRREERGPASVGLGQISMPAVTMQVGAQLVPVPPLRQLLQRGVDFGERAV